MESLPYEYIRWIVNDDVDPKHDLASDTKRIQDLKKSFVAFQTTGVLTGHLSITKDLN